MKGIHFATAEAIAEYIAAAKIESGPLFRPRLSPHSEAFANHGMTERTMNRLRMRYLERLPVATREIELQDGSRARECVYSPRSLRATAATPLPDAAVPIEGVQDLLDQTHHHHPDLRQTPAGGEGFRQPQDADFKI
jgi:hypothetical protein